MRADNEGGFWHILAGAAVGAVMGAVTQIAYNWITGEKLTSGLLSSVLTGSVGGAMAATGCPGAVIGLVNGVASAGAEALDQKMKYGKINNIGAVLTEGVVDGVFGALGGHGSGGNYVNSLGKRSFKRVKNIVQHKSIKSGLQEAKKAFTYYSKSSGYCYAENYNIRTVRNGAAFDFTSKIVSDIVRPPLPFVPPHGGGRFSGRLVLR